MPAGALVLLACCGLAAGDVGSGPRLDQAQVIGTHNSYHVAPDEVAASVMAAFAPAEAVANDHTHRPIAEQLDRLGIRQIELDLFRDSKGGAYVRPASLVLARAREKAVPPHDPDGKLLAPGIKVLHSPDFEFRTTVYTLADALGQVRSWSLGHPRHFPIFVLLELKAESFHPLAPRPEAWDTRGLDDLEREILAALDRRHILTPDDVRGSAATLREAVEGRGWPSLESARGKVVFLLDNEGRERDEYLRRSEVLAGRLLFVSVPRTHPAAAWMKRNDAVRSFDEIRSLVRAGFLVRTRADAGTREARANDTARRETALASGAQIVSTDYPEPDARFSGYAVRFGGGVVARPNPVTFPDGPPGKDIEALDRRPAEPASKRAAAASSPAE